MRKERDASACRHGHAKCRPRRPLTGRAASRCSAPAAPSGGSPVDVLAGLAPDWRVVALATGAQAALLEAQAREHRPAAVALASARPLDLPAGTIRVSGPDALVELATRDDVDLVVVATGGVVSLRPVLAALRAGKVVATANKETLVAGGHLVMREAHARAAERAAMDPRDALASALRG